MTVVAAVTVAVAVAVFVSMVVTSVRVIDSTVWIITRGLGNRRGRCCDPESRLCVEDFTKINLKH